MEAAQRREAIRQKLTEAQEAVVARELAEAFDVSRQVIVGDIALLRAAGLDILSTPKGYLLKKQSEKGVQRSVVSQHLPADTRDELYTIVDLGGEILDVTVEHPIYGLIRGDLNIASRLEADEFIEKIGKNPSALLSTLTDGLHMHTLRAKDEARMTKIQEALRKKGYLYE